MKQIAKFEKESSCPARLYNFPLCPLIFSSDIRHMCIITNIYNRGLVVCRYGSEGQRDYAHLAGSVGKDARALNSQRRHEAIESKSGSRVTG